MAQVRLRLALQKDGVAVFTGTPDFQGPCSLRYPTRTGALLRINGRTAGAFDREHRALTCELQRGVEVSLEVELRSLPTNGLPSGPGLRWWLMNRLAAQRPNGSAQVMAAQEPQPSAASERPWPLIGHSHLDVAWLWTYGETRRKAMRTFAIAANLLERHPDFIFSQSQPQLYEFVRDEDPMFFEHVRNLARAGRFDASVAALWVESDCNIPSGESLLRQMLYAHRFCAEHFQQTPAVAWLPDSFGFASTLPTLLAHAGIRYFATTKLQWNDTTRFPYAQFRWLGPDLSEVIAALVDSYDGALTPQRLARARARGEPLIVGYGDGGGGVTEPMVRQAQHAGRWTRPADWFQRLPVDALPVHADELYLEYHRGVYTTHHDVKSRNAYLERLLDDVEESISWCVATGLSADRIARWRARLDEVWKVLLKNQFHDVLPGTAVTAVYTDVHAEYDLADLALQAILTETRAVLPRSSEQPGRAVHEPRLKGDLYEFRNGLIEAWVRPDGVLAGLKASSGVKVVSQANALALYRDKPRRWDAWNIDAGYDLGARRPPAGAARIEDGRLVVPFAFPRSRFEMRLSLAAMEPFLRVDLHGDWRERHTLLRTESRLEIQADRVVYGAPHGVIERSAFARTPQEQAKFEVPGQRFALARSAAAAVAILALDTYGWNARVVEGGLHLGHSLLRSPMWPHPHADAGPQHLSYAFAPLEDPAIGLLEERYRSFVHQAPHTLFESDDAAVAIVACKPAQDGDGVIVRVRECDGRARPAHIRCRVPIRAVEAADALERRLDAELSLADRAIVAAMPAFGLRSFRVRF